MKAFYDEDMLTINSMKRVRAVSDTFYKIYETEVDWICTLVRERRPSEETYDGKCRQAKE